ncbi:TPA: hypothetical protein F7064_13240 [Legionella pneumophila]|nr:hypothetical protein [Legionella pneumophila]HAU4023022.1 hypothetical protein [Legionella pneumophila]
MNYDWCQKELSEIADVIDPHPSHRAPKSVSHGFSFAGIGDIDEYGNINHQKARQISEEFVIQQENSYQINSHTIGYGRVGTVGKVVKLKKQPYRYALSPTLAVINPKKDIDPYFLFYSIKSQTFFNKVESRMTGTTRPAIGIQLLRKITIEVPSIEIQKKIGFILSTLDSKIELNKKIDQTLESIAQAIFKSWFVDFDPVHAKANAQSEDEYDAIAKELDISREILDLFPSEFEESELGLIPKGWCYTTLEKDFNIVMGQSPNGSSYNLEGNGVPFFQGNADFGFRFPSIRVYCTEPKRFAKAGQTLISVRAPVGAINMAYEDCSIGRGLCVVSSKNKLDSYTYYSMLNIKDYLKTFENNGTVFGSINKKSFNEIPYLKPNQEIITAFEKIIANIDRMIFLNTSNARTTTKLRDLLLSKLLSGEIDVSNITLEPAND